MRCSLLWGSLSGPSVMRGKAVERALISEKLLPSDIDECVRKVPAFFLDI